jgi:altronate hydrolase
MDVNCGTVVDGSESVEAVGERIFRLILETASGRRSKSELLGFGEDEFAPWVIGATM